MSAQARLSEITLQHTVTLPAALPAKKTTYATLFPDVDSSAGAEFIQIPSNEIWRVTDLFISAAADVANADSDCFLTIEKNRNTPMHKSGLLTTLLQSNQQRPKLIRALGFEPHSIMRVIATNIAVPAMQRVNTFYMKVAKVVR